MVQVKLIALHVVMMDEIDAIARSRGNGNQSDAGVARDSVVNQLLAKMDGVQESPVPTLVIGLTNRHSLMDLCMSEPFTMSLYNSPMH